MIKLEKSKQLDWIIASIGLSCISIIIFLVLNNVVKRVEYEISKFGKIYIEDISKETSKYVKNEVENLISIIVSISNVISNNDNIITSESFKYIDSLSEKSEFYNFWVGNTDGVIYEMPSVSLNVKDEPFFIEAMLGKSGISKFNLSDHTNEDMYVIYAPIFDEKNKVKGVTVGEYDLKRLKDSINIPIIKDMGFVELFDKNGDKILQTQENVTYEKLNNFWEFFKNPKVEKDFNLKKMTDDIKSKKSGYIEYISGGVKKIAYYNSIGINNWYSFTVIPFDFIYSYVQDLRGIVDITVIFIISSIILLIVILILYGRYFYKKLLNKNEELMLSNEKFKVASLHSKNLIVEYNILENTFKYFGEDFIDFGLSENEEIALHELINKGIIHDKYLGDFNKMIMNLKDGHKKDFCVIRAYSKIGEEYWCKITFTNIYNTKGKAVRSIGTVEDITDQKEIELMHFKEKQNKIIMMSDIKENYVVNVNHKKYLNWYINGKANVNLDINRSYDENTIDLILKHVHKDDLRKLENALNLSTFKKNYESYIHKFSLEYRDIGNDNKVCWNKITIFLKEESESKDLLAYIYIKDITLKKEKEIHLKNKAEIDQLTGIYNRHTTESLITKILSKPYLNNSVNALLLIDLDGFKSVNDTYGHMVGDELLIEMANKLKLRFRSTDILGRMGGDEFILFITNFSHIKEIEYKADYVGCVIRSLDIIKKYKLNVSASIGIAIAPKHGLNYEELYKKSDIALYESKRSGKNKYIIYNEEKTP